MARTERYFFIPAACATGRQRSISAVEIRGELLGVNSFGSKASCTSRFWISGSFRMRIVSALSRARRRRRALRRREREPGAGDEIVAQLLEGRHVRRLWPPRLGRDRDPAQRAALDLAERRAPGERAERHAAGDDVGERRGVVRNVVELEALAPRDVLHHQMARACRRRTTRSPKLLGLGRRDHVPRPSAARLSDRPPRRSAGRRCRRCARSRLSVSKPGLAAIAGAMICGASPPTSSV